MKQNMNEYKEFQIMKANRFLLIVSFFMTALVTGCKYDVTAPLWNQPYTPPPSASITSVSPASEAKGGVNTITINGENLLVNSGGTTVYFDNYQVEIVSITQNSIVVRRPNLVADSATIKVIPQNAYAEGIIHGYKIDKVIENYGSFLQNLPLSVIAADNTGNLYVAETTEKNVHKVTPDGTNTIIGKTTYSPFDGKIGPDGNLYLTEKNRAIDKIDLSTGTKTKWTTLPSGIVVKYCDFSDNNFFYCGGTRTDLVILPFDLSASAVPSGNYADDDIQAIRFYNGYIYVASVPTSPVQPAKIWRDKVNADGSVGSRELVFDLNNISDSAAVSGIAFNSEGTMYVSTYSPTIPMIVVNPVTNSADAFYKGIIPAYCAGMSWGTGNFIYIITGNTTASQNWLVYKVDMGQKGASNY
jgi:hypothetical protein